MVAQVGQGEWLWDWGPRAFVYFLHVFLSGLSLFVFFPWVAEERNCFWVPFLSLKKRLIKVLSLSDVNTCFWLPMGTLVVFTAICLGSLTLAPCFKSI